MCPAGCKTNDPRGFNKGHSSKFREGSRVRQTPEEGRRIYRPKRFGNSSKDEDNSPKTLNDNNHQDSSKKFRQLIYYEFILFLIPIYYTYIHILIIFVFILIYYTNIPILILLLKLICNYFHIFKFSNFFTTQSIRYFCDNEKQYASESDTR